jgi:hypothetical protein
MNKNLLPHLGWAVVSLSAFLLGSQFFGKQRANVSSETKNAITTRLSERSSSSPSVSSSDNLQHTLTDRSFASGIPSMSDADIQSLGLEFRTAKGPIARRLAFSEMLKNLTPENARLMRENIAHLPQDSAEFREFHYAWGAIAGQEAITHGADTPKRDMAAALAGWAASDPASAMAYFDSLSPAQQSSGTHMKWGAAFGLADADPQLAAEFAIARFQNGDKEASKMIHIAASAALRSGDSQEITSFLTAVPEGEMSIQAHQHAARELAKNDPAGTVAWAVDLPEGDGKNHAVGSSFHVWAGRSPEKAAAAIASLPAADRDAATYGYATRVVHDDPAVGIEWASNIQNPEARGSAIIDTGKVFYRKDREAAREWLANANLPEESVQRITGGK